MEYANSKDLMFKKGVENMMKIANFYDENNFIKTLDSFNITLSSYKTYNTDLNNISIKLSITNNLSYLYTYDILDDEDIIKDNINFYDLLSNIIAYVEKINNENIKFYYDLRIKD